ncbi:MAG: S4 domain-containing protein, partial [Acholeplasma sp.]|nr:S4 domain-containing protein [Acholeplasma sp.]
MMKQLNLHETDFEKRLDYIIMERFPDISRNKIQSHIKTGNILVNNKIVKTGYLLKKHDVVTTIDLEIKPIIKTDLEAINLNLDIVYEDDDV